MVHSGRFILAAPALFLLCTPLRPEKTSLLSHAGSKHLDAVLESLGDFQESATDAGLDHLDVLVDASRSALRMVEEPQPGEISVEAKDALKRVIQIITETMLPTLDDLHTEDQELVDIVHKEVTECNSDMTKRLDGDIGQNQERAEKLLVEATDLAQQVDDLQSQNKSKHEQLDALMSNKQPPALCSSFPDLPVEELWEAYYKKVEEYSAAAAAEAKSLQDRRSERDSIVSSLVSTTERYVSTSAALSESFCDWKRNLQAACSTHEACYSEKSVRMEAQLDSFRGARNKRIAAYRAALKLIDKINTMMHENPEPMTDDAETRFPPSGKEVPEKAECDLDDLDPWDASVYGCDDKGQVEAMEANGVHLVGPIMLSASSKGSGSVLANRWEGSTSWSGVRGDAGAQMCAPGDPLDMYKYKVVIERGNYHLVGVATAMCCDGTNTYLSGPDSPFAALYSHYDGWNRHRGAATPVGIPDRATWWRDNWNGPKTILVTVNCANSSFRLGIEGGDSFLGEMRWPDSWSGVYPFAGQQDNIHIIAFEWHFQA